MPAVSCGRLLQSHSSSLSLSLLSYGAFSNAPQSPSVRASVREALTRVPYGAFNHLVVHEVIVNASAINLRHRGDDDDDGGVRRIRRQEDR